MARYITVCYGTLRKTQRGNFGNIRKTFRSYVIGQNLRRYVKNRTEFYLLWSSHKSHK